MNNKKSHVDMFIKFNLNKPYKHIIRGENNNEKYIYRISKMFYL